MPHAGSNFVVETGGFFFPLDGFFGGTAFDSFEQRSNSFNDDRKVFFKNSWDISEFVKKFFCNLQNKMLLAYLTLKNLF